MKLPIILTHKKFQAAFAASASVLFGIFGPAMAESATFWIALGSITPTDWAVILGPILVAIGAQGWADSGKEAAKIAAAQTNNGIEELAQLNAELAELQKEM